MVVGYRKQKKTTMCFYAFFILRTYKKVFAGDIKSTMSGPIGPMWFDPAPQGYPWERLMVPINITDQKVRLYPESHTNKLYQNYKNTNISTKNNYCIYGTPQSYGRFPICSGIVLPNCLEISSVHNMYVYISIIIYKPICTAVV